MLECLIIGDSIGVGIKANRPDCVSYSKVGISSSAWNVKYSKSFESKIAIISLGSNDWSEKITKNNLVKIRNRITANKVYWIMPNIKPKIKAVIRDVALAHGDEIVIIPSVSKDGVHPTLSGYRYLAKQTKTP